MSSVNGGGGLEAPSTPARKCSLTANNNNNETSSPSKMMVAGPQPKCSNGRNELIQKLQRDLEDQRVARASEHDRVEAKAAKIKHWVITRLQEVGNNIGRRVTPLDRRTPTGNSSSSVSRSHLTNQHYEQPYVLESQNERLRQENQKCSTQLALLKTCADNTAAARTSSQLFMSRSVVGCLPSGVVMSEQLSVSVAASANVRHVDSGTDDSGNTSDLNEPAHAAAAAAAKREPLMTQSMNARLLHVDDKENALSRSNPGSPRWLRRSRLLKHSADKVNPQSRTHSLPRTPKTVPTGKKLTMAWPPGQHDQPVPVHHLPEQPVPRPRQARVPEPHAYLISDDILRIERDSLNPLDCRSMESSQCHIQTMDDRDSLQMGAYREGDYVNISELPFMSSRLDVPLPPSDPPPQPPKHRQVPAWESKLRALADQCLGPQAGGAAAAAEEPPTRDTHSFDHFPGTMGPGPAAEWRSSTERTTSADSGQLTGKDSSCDRIQVPVFTTRRASHKHKPTSSSSSCGGDGTRLHVKSSQPSSQEFDSSPQPLDCRSSAGSSCKQANPYATSSILGTPRRHGKHKQQHQLRTVSSSDEDNDESDYAVPPDASWQQTGTKSAFSVVQNESGMQISLIAEPEVIEKSGYLMNVSDSRMKSLKRRWCALRNGELALFKSQKDEHRDPLARFAVADISSVTKIDSKTGIGMEIILPTATHRFTAESKTITEEWIKVLNKAIKCGNAMTSSDVSDGAQVSGWLTRVKCGHAKRCYAVLAGTRLLFCKSSTNTANASQMSVQGASITETVRSSDDSSSSDDNLTAESCHPHRASSSSASRHRVSANSQAADDQHDHTINVQLPSQPPLYLVFSHVEDKERWLYHLRVASNAGHLDGTPFEVLVQRLLNVGGDSTSTLWDNVLLANVNQPPTQTMLTVQADNAKDALALARACHLFSTVGMQPSAIQYHIDLAQNTLQQALKNDDLKNELFAQLIRLSNCPQATGLQAWKLLSLAVSLCVPSQYALLWLLRKHLARWACMGGDEASMAQFAQQALQRCLANGPRCERPSKLEATSLLTRNPTACQLPHSLAMQLPDGRYEVVTFDGSSLVLECLSQLCNASGCRAPLIAGYALHSDDPHDANNVPVLNNKEKLCDVLSRWEQQLCDERTGKVSARMIRLQMRRRFYWPHLTAAETEAERSYLIHESATAVQQGQLPVSPELANELCALFAQLLLGAHVPDDVDRLNDALNRFYPEKLLQMTSKSVLHTNLSARWHELSTTSAAECQRVIVSVLRRWPYFAGIQYTAAMRWRQDERVRICVNHAGIHLLNAHNLELITSYSYATVLSFGGYHDDFMLTVSRPTTAARGTGNDDEPTKERLTFSMPKFNILQLTLLIADYIKCRRLVMQQTVMTTTATNSVSTLPRTPRKSPKQHPPTPATTTSSSRLGTISRV